MMYFWIGFLIGGVFALILSTFIENQALKQEKERADFAVKTALWWKGKAKESERIVQAQLETIKDYKKEIKNLKEGAKNEQ